ncbi:GNAT family N-acetyltransferase [Tissierella carlieri]|uniref:GNAT family N-acetyltransferase n=1 Tax=Tissierella carlieri TaxID=689904 RepID=A0ABT1SA36_9FIRM|nr:GNAT family N-acetyltransferase [Tissierella carlieri]MCQ4923331.1 GNAT family N-acetyltransferase [Tissierella carlieri]
MIKVDGLKIINYKKVTNDWSPSFSGIVSGECKGNLWVDNIENPNIAIAESYAVGTGRFNNIIPIDIYVEEEHRNKGLGLILTRELVNECIKIGVTVQWDCMESNSPSRRLAEKAGFKFIKQDEVYWFDI